MKTFKKNKKNIRKTKKIQKGGRVLGEGVSGITFYEPKLNCKNGSQPNNTYVSKLTTKNIHNYEVSIREKIKDTNIGIIPVKGCEWNGNPKNYNNIIKKFKNTKKDKNVKYLVYSKFGGVTMDSLHLDKLNLEELIPYLEKYKDFVKKVDDWSRTNKIIHRDIHEENIVYNDSFYLIDFEKILDYNEIIKYFDKPSYSSLKKQHTTNEKKINYMIERENFRLLNVLADIINKNKNIPKDSLFITSDFNHKTIEQLEDLIKELETDVKGRAEGSIIQPEDSSRIFADAMILEKPLVKSAAAGGGGGF